MRAIASEEAGVPEPNERRSAESLPTEFTWPRHAACAMNAEVAVPRGKRCTVDVPQMRLAIRVQAQLAFTRSANRLPRSA